MIVKEEAKAPFIDLVNYFADNNTIYNLCHKIQNMKYIETILQVENKIDKILYVRTLMQCCNNYFNKVLFDFTNREIDFLYRHYYCKTPLTEIAKLYDYSDKRIKSMYVTTSYKLRRVYGVV